MSLPTIQVFQRQVYGQPKVYPACSLSEKLAQLAGCKTFNAHHLRLLRSMGYTIEQVPDPDGRIPQ